MISKKLQQARDVLRNLQEELIEDIDDMLENEGESTEWVDYDQYDDRIGEIQNTIDIIDELLERAG